MEDKKKLLKYLKSLDLLVIATQGKTPNAATIHYGIDEDFTIYIVTPPSTEHGGNFSKNPEVACVVVDTNQKMYKTDKKIGAQIKGRVKELKNRKEMKDALLIWSKGKPDIADSYIEKIYSGEYTSRPFKIIPTQIKWFNEELYEKEGIKIFSF